MYVENSALAFHQMERLGEVKRLAETTLSIKHGYFALVTNLSEKFFDSRM